LVAPVLPSTDPKPPTPPSRPDPGAAARKPQPQEMRPQAPVRRRPTAPPVQSAPTRQLQPDDLICGMCGEGNPPTRRFCSRCGNSLQTATVVPTPWWRRILRAIQQRRVHPAGARPKRRLKLLTLRGLNSALRRMLVVAALLAALVYAISPAMRNVVNGFVGSLKNRVESAITQKPVKIVPIGTEATAQLPDHPAAKATDGLVNTYWVALKAADKPSLMLTFDRPTRLVQAIVHNGGGDDPQALGRPAKLHVVFFKADTPIGITDVDLEDTPDEQKVDFTGGDDATRVEIQVVDVHPGTANPGLALSEIELFQRAP
jgi:hypothetical protein